MQRHRTYLLVILVIAMIFNNVESVAFGLALQNIKLDLSLTDTQLGTLTGIAFALFYSFAGIAIARWADRGDRVAIISITVAIWSVLVAACGIAANFVQMLLLRVGVGIGESGCVPASQSLIADYFDRAERPRANAIYMGGGGISALVGYGVAGWLNQLYGWRAMFLALGAPGIVIAVVVWFTLKEPRFERPHEGKVVGRSADAPRSLLTATAGLTTPPSLKDIAVTLWSNVTLRHVLLFWSASSFFITGLWQWQPAFFVRHHGLNTGELGTWFAIAYGVGGVVGPFLGGSWATRYAANNESLQLRMAGIAYIALMVLATLIYVVPNYYVAFALLGVYAIVANAFLAPVWAMVQTLVPDNMRAASAAIFALVGGLVGNGLGSLAVGALSDVFEMRFGEESLRYALLTLCPGFLWAAWHLRQASKSVKCDMDLTQQRHSEYQVETRAVRPSSSVSY